MKKVIYSLILFAAVLTGCTKFDDPVTENYGSGPDISIEVTATADSTFTFTLTPGAGTNYYSYVIDESADTVALDPASLLKGNYSSVSQAVLNVSEASTFTYNMRDAKGSPLCEPNTTYQIYAVAASDKGIVGKMAVMTVKTTDAGAPLFIDKASSPSTKSALILFDQEVLRGTGAVSAVYYEEYNFGTPIAVEEVGVTISSDVVTFTAADVPAGAYVTFSWEEGAFVDATGNKCGAFTSTINEDGETLDDIFENAVWVHCANANWSVADSYVAPATGASIADWEEFKATVTMPFDIYYNEDDVQTGDLTVTYTSDSRTITKKLTADQWSVEGKAITFVLPNEPEVGDMITFNMAEGIIFDVNGNTNNAYSSEAISWKYVGFVATKDMVLGTFQFLYQSAYDSTPVTYNGGTFTIVEDPENEELENAVIIKDLYMEGSELPGYYDLEACKLYVGAWYSLGLYAASSATYGLITINWNDTSGDWIPFDINKDKTLTSGDFGVYALDETFTSYLGWWERATIAAFVPASDSSRAGVASHGKAAKKVQKRGITSKARVRK